ncbi:AraC family transcriptional regulator [Paenibacillus nasutitermitis]|uniref:HTH-type transcriptional activator RhaR n=1 Tax=Paenibacillus nasutitermitis TaxID=1652958 RepID=A0A916ZCY4_9BACL|nr:AraC family transcriptional regulator [Paenibacillus nasutitermitis]GGD88816.1 HTH-type transcriptional activator RhaR [Paenibacillus nasutitermitis]
MSAGRTRKHYLTKEVLEPGHFLTIQDVYEHQWLLEHTHDFPEMIYVLSGSGTQYINGIDIKAKEGDVYLIPIGTTHVFRPTVNATSVNSLRVRNVIFRTEWLEDLNGILMDPEVKNLTDWLLGRPVSIESGPQPFWLQITDKQAGIRAQTERMKALVEQQPPLFQTRLTSSVLDLLSLLCLATNGGRLQQAEWPPEPDMHPMKALILEALQAMPLGAVSLKEVAQRINRSERQLSRLFQQHFEMSFVSYMQEYRLQESMKLLEQSSSTVKEIMSRIGFEDADHYYELFKRKTGVTPGQYRRQALKRGTLF